MIHQLDLDPGSPIWNQFMTASRMAAAAGVNTSYSRAKLYRVQMGLETDTRHDEPAIQWGISQESNAINALFNITNLAFLSNTYTFINDRYPGYGATPDAFSIDGSIGLEVKCPFYRTVPYDHISVPHMCQLQTCMAITERSEWLYASYTPNAVKVWVVAFNSSYWEGILYWAEEFRRYRMRGEPPPRVEQAVRLNLLENINVIAVPYVRPVN